MTKTFLGWRVLKLGKRKNEIKGRDDTQHSGRRLELTGRDDQWNLCAGGRNGLETLKNQKKYI